MEEILYLDSPVEKILSRGHMVLWFDKAVIESIYKNFRVVHEGQLRLVFTTDMKVLLSYPAYNFPSLHEPKFCLVEYPTLFSLFSY